MQKSVSIDQLTDILFRADERITADVLAQRGRAETWYDSKMQINLYGFSGYCGGSIETREARHFYGIGLPLALQWALHVNNGANVKRKQSIDQKPLKQALFELRAAGFSNEQISVIRSFLHSSFMRLVHSPDNRHFVQRLMDQGFDTDRMCIADNDNAFLGKEIIAFAEKDSSLSQNYEGASTISPIFDDLMQDQIRAQFKERCKEYIEHNDSGILTPANARKAKRLMLS